MSLLDNASLLLTPNAYKEGKLYSVIPSNGNGDFTATRATTATRVNAAGLVDLVPYNLASWSEQFDNAAWIKALASVAPNVATAPNGTLTADKIIASVSASGSHFIYQLNTTSTTSPFVFSCYAKASEYNRFGLRASSSNIIFDLSNGTIVNQAGPTTASINSVGDGWYLCQMITTQTNIGNFQLCPISSTSTVFDFPGDGVSGVFIWGAQLVEGTSARDYLRTETRLNIPRVDYSLGGCPNILLEPQRTNLALQSSSFDSAWTKVSVSVVANSTTSPSGVTDADTITSTTTSQALIVQLPTIVSGTNYTVSFYVKQNTQRFVYIRFTAQSVSDNYVSAVFDLQDGTVGQTAVGGTSGTLIGTKVETAANGFYRISLTASINITSANFGIGFAAAKTGNTFSNFGAIIDPITNGNSFFLWGAQLEAGAYATSYIPTTTASVTRNADLIQNTNALSLIGQTSGVFFFDFFYKQSLDSATDLWWINNVTNSYILRMRIASSNSLNILYANVGSAQNLTTSFTLIPNNNYKVAVSYDYATTTSKLFVNGVLIGTTVGSIAYPTNQGKIYSGNLFSNVSFLSLQTFALFPTPLTDAQCIALTQ